MGITAHWIKETKNNQWWLYREVTTFKDISEPYTRHNLTHYFAGLCKCVGMITKTTSKLLCLMTDNASNNDTTCDKLKQILHHQHIYSFDLFKQRLLCLAHVLNLAIISVMSILTHIGTIETTTAIWEYDPTLPTNWALRGSLNIVSAIRTLAIKIQSMGQYITYFHQPSGGLQLEDDGEYSSIQSSKYEVNLRGTDEKVGWGNWEDKWNWGHRYRDSGVMMRQHNEEMSQEDEIFKLENYSYSMGLCSMVYKAVAKGQKQCALERY